MEHVTDDCQCAGKLCTRCQARHCVGNYSRRKGDKIKSRCKFCERLKNKTWRENNKEYNRARMKAYSQTDAGRESQKRHDQRPERKESKRLREQIRRAKRREIEAPQREAKRVLKEGRMEQTRLRTPARKRADGRAYRRRHPDAWKSYYLKNKPYMHDRIMRWRENNPGAHAAIQARRKTRQTQAGGSYTVEQWKDLKKKYNYTCLSCGRNDVKLTADHVIPISKGGTSNIENIQPLCKPCNCSKHNKIIDFRPKNS